MYQCLFFVVDPFCGLHSLLISAAWGVWEMPKIILQNYILYCSLLLSFSNCFQHCSLVSTKLWLVKFSQAHLICKYLPLCSSFIIVTNNFNCKVWYHHKAHKGKWECQKEYIITKTNQNGTIFLTTQIIFIYIFSFLEPLMQLRSNEKEAKRGITTILHSSQNSNFQATSVCLFPCELLPKNSWQHR